MCKKIVLTEQTVEIVNRFSKEDKADLFEMLIGHACGERVMIEGVSADVALLFVDICKDNHNREALQAMRAKAGKKGMASRWGSRGKETVADSNQNFVTKTGNKQGSVIKTDNKNNKHGFVITNDNKNNNNNKAENEAKSETTPLNPHTQAHAREYMFTSYNLDNNINNIDSAKAELLNLSSKVLTPTPAHEEEAEKIDFAKIKAYWNEKVKACGSKMKTISVMNDNRKKHIKARLKDCGGDAAQIYLAIDISTSSGFMNGKNPRGWIATFDWIFLPTNFPKVIEGNYTNNTESITYQNATQNDERYQDRRGWRAPVLTDEERDRLNKRPEEYDNSRSTLQSSGRVLP